MQGLHGRVTKLACDTGPGVVSANEPPHSQGQPQHSTLAAVVGSQHLAAYDEVETYDAIFSFHTAAVQQHVWFSVSRLKISRDAADENQEKYLDAQAEEWYRSLKSASFWSTLMTKIVEHFPLTAIEKEFRSSIIFGTRWLEEKVAYKSTTMERGDLIQAPSDTFSDTYASGATAPHLKEVVATEMATDEPKTRPVVWAGQLFIKRAGWRTETMTATSNDTVAALKARMRLPVERLVWGRYELCEDDKTLGSYGVPKEVRPHQSSLPQAPHCRCDRATLNPVSGTRRR